MQDQNEITRDMIEALQVAAGEYGDHLLVATCTRALRGSKKALAIVAKIIAENAAAAQED